MDRFEEENQMANGNSWVKVSGSIWGGFRDASALLADGMSVLITGGTQNPLLGAGSRKAWLFDGTGISQLSATMTEPRFGHTATTLTTEQVLIAGSNPLLANDVSFTAELYDPFAKAFTATGKLAHPRGWHTATLLPSGNVLVVGGQDPYLKNQGSMVLHTTAEIYDFRARTFRLAKGQLHNGMRSHTATLLDDGNTVLLVGGVYAELFDVQTEMFTSIPRPKVATTPPSVIARSMHAAAKLPNGNVLIAGGYPHGSSGPPAEEIFDCQTKQFVLVPSLGKTAFGLTLTTLPSGDVLAVGGSVEGEKVSGLTIDDHYSVFDHTANTFAVAGGMDRIAFHTATPLASGAVLVVGGVSISTQFPSAGSLYTPQLATLHIRFHGNGAGQVAVQPGGASCVATADLQVAAGLRVYLRAQASGGWTIVDEPLYRLPLPLKGKPRPVKFKQNAFDGWGTAGALDKTNPISVVMNGDQTVDVNFNIHTGTIVSPKFPPFRLPA
jgi:hypothetical protein